MKLKPDLRDLATCAFCPDLCLARCPVSLASGDLSLAPWGKQSALWRLNQGKPWTSENARPLLMCLGCLACQELCDHDIDVPSNLFAGRALARNQGGGDILPSVPSISREESWRLVRTAAPSWRLSEDAEALLVVGSDPGFFGGSEVLAAVFASLDAVGDQTIGVTPDSVLDTGVRFWESGHQDQALAAARDLRKRMTRYRRMYFLNPEDLSFMAFGWPLLDLEPGCKVLPLLDVIHLRIDRLRILGSEHEVAYHDPCHFARYLGYLRPPRDILTHILGKPPLELPATGADTRCCGGGGGMDWWDPDLAERMASRLMEDRVRVFAEKLVVSCPRCYRTLRTRHQDEVETIYHMVARCGGG